MPIGVNVEAINYLVALESKLDVGAGMFLLHDKQRNIIMTLV